MKTVAVIGAGPAGLVAAKTLIHSLPEQTFRVTLFERSSRIGGLWDVESPAEDGLIDPEMRTNLTQFTVSFSDLSWESINVNPKYDIYHPDEAATNVLTAPIYPKAWQVNRYLQQYSERFIPEDIVSFNTQVVRAERIQQDEQSQWRITSVNYHSKDPVELECTYDYLIVASGFSSQPRMIGCGLPDVVSGPRIIHSSQFRKLSDLSTNEEPLKRGRVLVVGGSHSGSDIATSIASEMSNARYSPAEHRAQQLEIVHVTPQEMYSIPRFVRAGNEACAFVPLDCRLYNSALRPSGPISFSYGQMTSEKAQGTRALLQCLLEGDKSAPGSQAIGGEVIAPPYAVVNDSYVAFVRSGAISPKIGRLLRLTRNEAKETSKDEPCLLCATVSGGNNIFEIEDVAAVVYATGYTASTALDFLSDDVKAQIGYDSAYPRLPLLLEKDFLTCTAAVPNLAFIGFTAGPYWGVMEMQARATAKRWAFNTISGSEACVNQDSAKIRSYMHELRSAMTNNKSLVPQNLFGDYVGLMEQASRELKLERVDLNWGEREGPICPARYSNAGADQKEARKTMARLQEVVHRAMTGTFVARAAFQALQGTWWSQDEATLKSVPPLQNKNLTVIADFHRRMPTESVIDFEYLYIEKSTPIAGVGHDSVEGARRVYRYEEAVDKISVWSVQDDDKLTASVRLFNLEFDPTGSGSKMQNWSATGNVVGTAETVLYQFLFSGVALRSWSVRTEIDGQIKSVRSWLR